MGNRMVLVQVANFLQTEFVLAQLEFLRISHILQISSFRLHHLVLILLSDLEWSITLGSL